MDDKSKSLFNQSVKVDGAGNTVSPTYNNNVTFGVIPKLELIHGPVQHHEQDGTFITKYVVKMSAPAARLTVQAQGERLLDLDVSRPTVGGNSMTSKNDYRRWVDDKGFIAESFSSPSGTYEISVKSNSDALPQIAHQVEP